MRPLPNLQTDRLVERSVVALRERIVAGAFGPDGELPAQGELCRQMGVSRSVIREAMRKLESQGLLFISQGRRPRVQPAGLGPVTDGLQLLMRRKHVSVGQLMEVRRSVEAEIAALAASRATPDGIARLRASVDGLSRAPGLEEQVDSDVRFHRVLAEETGNPLFVLVLDALAELLRTSRRTTIGLGGIRRAHSGHSAVLAAVERRDSEGARRAMLAHLDAAQRDLETLAGGKARC